MKYLNVFGDVYDDGEPCFLTTAPGVLVYNRVTRNWVTWASLEAKATAESHSWQTREVGIPSLTWQERNSRISGLVWFPGLDDTAGLSTEAVTNGEGWTAAAGATPPTGWTVDGDVDFDLTAGVVTITATDEVTFSQTLTTVAGTVYVLEALLGDATTGDVLVTVDDVSATLGESGPRAGSFRALDTSTDVVFTLPAGSVLVLDYVRCYEEAELTGAGPAPGGVITPPAFEVRGPYNAFGTKFFVQKFADASKECMVWLDVDSDPDPDLALSKLQVCESSLSDRVKLAIHAQLEADGCSGLPCITPGGKVQKKYREDE